MSCSHDVDEAIRRAGLRRTVSRAVVASTLRHHSGHRTVEEIESLAEADYPAQLGVARSSFYRALDALEGVGLVVAVRTGHGETRFEWVGDDAPHHHLVCDACGHTIEVELESAASLGLEAQDAHGFSTRVQHLALRGICASCSARGDRAR